MLAEEKAIYGLGNYQLTIDPLFMPGFGDKLASTAESQNPDYAAAKQELVKVAPPLIDRSWHRFGPCPNELHPKTEPQPAVPFSAGVAWW